jgi:hypothetical protein
LCDKGYLCSLPAFFFGTVGASENMLRCAQRGGASAIRLGKKETPKKKFRACERDKGFEPLTAPPFEKGGRKLSKRQSPTDR